MKNKIAFLFLLYNDMNYEELWRDFFEKNLNNCNIYIYCKNKTKLNIFSDNIVHIDIDTKYGDSSVVIAQNKLLEVALSDIENSHFIFLSGSCIPIKNLLYISKKLDKEYSYFNICPDSQLDRIPLEYRNNNPGIILKKSSQWCILNRKHAEHLVKNEDYLDWFNFEYIAPDEHCYISKLYSDGFEGELKITENVSVGATTFTNWSDVPYKYISNHFGLKSYHYIDTNELSYIINSESLFARKFLRGCAMDNNISLNEYVIKECKI